MSILEKGDRYILGLVRKEGGLDGWAKVSRLVYPLVIKMSPELVSVRKGEDGGGFARLTDAGNVVLDWTSP